MSIFTINTCINFKLKKLTKNIIITEKVILNFYVYRINLEMNKLNIIKVKEIESINYNLFFKVFYIESIRFLRFIKT